MSDPVDIEVRIKATKAEVTLAKLNAALKITAEREKQVAIKSQIMNQRLSNAAKAGNRAGKGFKVANIAMASFIGNLTSRAVSAGITTLINGFRKVIDEGRSFEAGLVQIAKTTGLSDDAIKSFGVEIQNIGKRIPIATESLLDIAKVAGQLGIKGQENLAAFTETMAKLQLATDITGEEGSQNVAKILTITGELEKNGTDNIEKFGSVITELGNNFAATESQILKVANEVAKGTTVFRISSEDVLGLATAFKVTGSEAEISGSAIQEIFKKIGQATERGGSKLTKFAEAANLTEDAFTTLFREDPTAAFVKLTEGLGKAGLTGTKLNERMAELGFSNKRVVKSLGPLITRYQVLSDSISQARKESVRKTALDKETKKAQDTLNADLQKLDNSFNRLSTTIFDRMNPALREIVKNSTDLLDSINRLGVVETLSNKMETLQKESLRATSSIILTTSGLDNLAKSAGITGDSIADLAEETGLLEGIADSLTGGLSNLGESTADINKKSRKSNKVILDLSEGYKTLDTDTQNYLDILNSTTQGYERAKSPLLSYTKLIDGANAPLMRLALIQSLLVNKGKDSAKEIVLFEQEKTKDLKKFFKEEEIAKLSSAFLMQKSEEDRIAFTSFVISRGKALRTDAFKTSIGQGKAQVAAERARQDELNLLRKEELDGYKALADANKELITKREADKLVELGNDNIFKDERLIQIQEFFTAEEEAAIQSKINLVDNAIEKEALITKALSDSLTARDDLEKEAKKKREQNEKVAARKSLNLDKQLGQAKLSLAQASATSLAQLAGANNKVMFAISKAFAIADIIMRGAQAETLIAATIPPPANIPVIAKQALFTKFQLATVAATAIGQAAGFEQGGIVGGSSFTGDRVQARVNSGEMILNRSQQKQLFNMANGSSSQNQSQEITSNITVVLDGEVVGEAVSRQVANGLVLGEVQ